MGERIKPSPTAGAESEAVRAGELVSEVLRLDGENDHVGIFMYLKGVPFDAKQVLYSLYQLLTNGRFQSAFIVAKLLVGRGMDNPAVDLARSVGGVLFENAEDEGIGSECLARSVRRLGANAKLRQTFHDSVLEPTFRHIPPLIAAKQDRNLESRLLRIWRIGMGEEAGPAAQHGDVSVRPQAGSPEPASPSEPKARAQRRPAMAISDSTKIALAFLARGADKDWRTSFSRFVESYKRFPAGADHRLYVIFKGFRNNQDLEEGTKLFAELDHTPIHVPDNGFDIGAYIRTAARIPEATSCFLNTHSEIVAPEWLGHLADNLKKPGVGLVGATGSFESLAHYSSVFPPFPNFHIRPNAFMLRTELFRSLTDGLKIRNKGDAYLFESGPAGFSRQVMALGLQTLVVGRNGQGYPPDSWPTSGTFRQAGQENLLVSDNHTRHYDSLPFEGKLALARMTWGEYLPVPSARTTATDGAWPEGGAVTAEILRLDDKGDHVGVFTYLYNTPYDPTHALFALYLLMISGRFQSAFLVAKVMAGARHRNPTIDLARSIGGALFGNQEDEAHGTEHLARWVDNMTSDQREKFRNQVAAPTFDQALKKEVIAGNRDLEAKLLRICDIVFPERAPLRKAASTPRAKRSAKARHAAEGQDA